MSYVAKRPFTAKPEDVIGTVAFSNAMYRNKPITGTYDLVKGFQEGGNGEGFVTVREADGKKSRITVYKNSGYEIEFKEGYVVNPPRRGRGRPKSANSNQAKRSNKAA